MSQEPANLYSVLGVSRGATQEEIQAAFLGWHRRNEAGESIPGALWERIQYAHEVLRDPRRRQTYDSLIADMAGPLLGLDLKVSASRLPLVDSAQVVYALATVNPGETPDRGRKPLNLGLVIDRSTSMRGKRLEKVMSAVGLLLEKLGPDDTLSLVSFSDRAEIVLPAATLGKAARSADPETVAAWSDPRRRLWSITASGGTEIVRGLRAGLDQVSRGANGNNISHLILMTDGHTYGDVADCLKLAESAVALGIGITAFGIGTDWNDNFLDALVAPSGGQSHFIESPDHVLLHLEERLLGLGTIYARNLSLRRSWSGEIALRSGFKLTPFPQPLTLDLDPIPLGDLEGRSPLTVLLEFLVAPQTIATRLPLPIDISFTPIDGAEKTAVGVIPLMVEGESDLAAAPTVTLLEAARRLNLYRMQEKAWEDAESGKPGTAAARMRRLTSRYMETGDLRLARQAQLEAEQLARQGAISAEGHKLLKYGTRSLIGQIEP